VLQALIFNICNGHQSTLNYYMMRRMNSFKVKSGHHFH